MSGDRERDRRRVGDATRQRIDELADGWGVPEDDKAGRAPDAAAPPPPPSRPKRPSAPPPPPPRSPPRSGTSADTVPVDKHSPEELGLTEDATVLQPPDRPKTPPGPGTQLRVPAMLPRKRGLGGDVRYVFTAVFGLAEARRELAAVTAQIETERAERAERLLAVARVTVADETITLPVVRNARAELEQFEEDRSRVAGAAAAAEAEIATLERGRTAESETNEVKIKQLQAELKSIKDSLHPLERAATAARNRGADLKVTLEDLDRKIATTKASMVSVKGQADPATVEATLASLRAEREGVAQEEPAIAAELDDLDPTIASLAASQAEAETNIETTEREESEAVVRTAEKIAAVRARKAVEERAMIDADRERDAALTELGEALAVDRPAEITHRLRAVDEHEISIATLERRSLELAEIVGGVNRGAVVRGAAILLLAAGLVAALVILIVTR